MPNEIRYYLKVKGGGWREWNGRPQRTSTKEWRHGEPFRVKGCPDEFVEEVNAYRDVTPSELNAVISSVDD